MDKKIDKKIDNCQFLNNIKDIIDNNDEISEINKKIDDIFIKYDNILNNIDKKYICSDKWIKYKN